MSTEASIQSKLSSTFYFSRSSTEVESQSWEETTKTGKSINYMVSMMSVLENMEMTQFGNGLHKSSNASLSQLSSTALSSAFTEVSLPKLRPLTRSEILIGKRTSLIMVHFVICCGQILLMTARKDSIHHPEELVSVGEMTLATSSAIPMTWRWYAELIS